MSFSSLIFVTGFLPVFLLLYTLIPGVRRKNLLLLLASLLFYAAGGLSSLVLLLLLCAAAEYCGRALWNCRSGEAEEAERKKQERRIFAAGIGLLLIALGIFKYSGFLLRELSGLFGVQIPVPRLLLPLGISFYSFKLISYLSDVYTGKLSPQCYRDILLYTVNFHQVMQGPISRYPEFSGELEERSVTAEDFSEGAFRFCTGLAKKALLADHAGKLAEQLLPLQLTALSEQAAAGAASGGPSVFAAWTGSLFYMLQLYLDFSAYSDMALGLGRMCGFHYPENFAYPYAAASVRDFWRRWHISLSSFFRDYVYIPLGGSRVSLPILLRNLFLVWLLTGLWHGASWNFILWGLYYFAFLAAESLVREWRRRERKGPELIFVRQLSERLRGNERIRRAAGLILQILRHLYTLLVVYFGWVLFRFSDFAVLTRVLRLMLGLSGDAEFMDSISLLTLKNNLFFTVAALIAVTPLMRCLGEEHRRSMRRSEAFRRREKRRREEKEAAASYGDDSLAQMEMLSEPSPEPESPADAHREAYRRLRQRIRLRAAYARRAEAIYYIERSLLALLLLGLSVMAMVGSSYMPFLYNQF